MTITLSFNKQTKFYTLNGTQKVSAKQAGRCMADLMNNKTPYTLTHKNGVRTFTFRES